MISLTGIRKLQILSLLAVITLCLPVSAPCLAEGSHPSPAFSAFAHHPATMAVPDGPAVSTLADLYPLLRDALLFAAPSEVRNPLLEDISSCQTTGQPRIIIQTIDGGFSITAGSRVRSITDAEFTLPLARFLALLQEQVSADPDTRSIASARFVLSGASLIDLRFDFTDGSRFEAVAPGLVYPLAELQDLPTTPGRTRNMLGYLVGSTTGSSWATVLHHGGKLNFISPAWYWLDPDKPGLFKKDPNFGSFSDDQVREVVARAHAMKIQVLVLFHNLTNDQASAKDLLHRVLSEPALRQKCIDDIIAHVEKFNFDGVNMDFEMIHLQDRDGYSEFMRLLGIRLKAIGKLSTIAVPAKFSDTVNSWNGQFDYAKLGQYSDIVMVMTYNEHGKWSKPGPVASLPWVEKAMKYAVSKIPPEKVMMGYPTYGYDWTEGGSCKSLSCRSAAALLVSQQAELKWHSWYASPYFEYTDSSHRKHTVWFETSESLKMKMLLLDKYNLNGAGMWRLGMETEDFWEIVTR